LVALANMRPEQLANFGRVVKCYERNPKIAPNRTAASLPFTPVFVLGTTVERQPTLGIHSCARPTNAIRHRYRPSRDHPVA
jgi:hypothetical protein